MLGDRQSTDSGPDAFAERDAMSDAPYKWLDMADAPKDGTAGILYFSVGSCRIPYVARYRKGFIDPRSGVADWETVHPIPGDAPTGWLPIVWKD